MSWPCAADAVRSAVVLWLFGRWYESSWGTRDYLKFFFASTVGAVSGAAGAESGRGGAIIRLTEAMDETAVDITSTTASIFVGSLFIGLGGDDLRWTCWLSQGVCRSKRF